MKTKSSSFQSQRGVYGIVVLCMVAIALVVGLRFVLTQSTSSDVSAAKNPGGKDTFLSDNPRLLNGTPCTKAGSPQFFWAGGDVSKACLVLVTKGNRGTKVEGGYLYSCIYKNKYLATGNGRGGLVKVTPQHCITAGVLPSYLEDLPSRKVTLDTSGNITGGPGAVYCSSTEYKWSGTSESAKCFKIGAKPVVKVDGSNSTEGYVDYCSNLNVTRSNVFADKDGCCGGANSDILRQYPKLQGICNSWRPVPGGVH